MCGILGFAGSSETRCDVDAALRSLSHRGPDGSGQTTHEVGGVAVGLGHTRLSILDLSVAGQQPMRSRDGRWCVVYNGEIYNHTDLRNQLCGPFKGHSDSETLVECLAAWGIEKLLPQLNGMFAFAALDTVEAKLYLVRDAFGIKPLYYTDPLGSHFVFASEVRAIRALTGTNADVSAEGLQCFLTLRYVPSPGTAWNGVKRLQPGALLTFDLSTGRADVARYVEPTEDVFRGSIDDAVEQYCELLARVVERQLLSDVPVGILLSGGIDSALIASLCHRRGVQLPTFTVGFGDLHPECEIEDAAETAEVTGMEHFHVKVTAADLWSTLESGVDSIEEPLGTPSILPMSHLVHKARERVTVVLTGQGSDEPWGGYFRYQAEIARRLIPFPSMLRGFRVFGNLAPRRDWIERGLRTLPVPGMAERFQESYALFSSSERLRLTGRSDDGGALKSIADWLRWLGHGDMGREDLEPVESMMRIDSRMNLADDLLLYGDKLAMAASLEARVPMLDIELVRFVESLPRTYKVGLRRTKIVHKLAAQKFLPHSIVNRGKKGFAVPFNAWSRDVWREQIEAILLSDSAAHWQFLDRAEVLRLWKEHLRGKRDLSRKIFALLVLASWMERTCQGGVNAH